MRKERRRMRDGGKGECRKRKGRTDIAVLLLKGEVALPDGIGGVVGVLGIGEIVDLGLELVALWKEGVGWCKRGETWSRR